MPTELLVVNKTDAAGDLQLARLRHAQLGAVFVSARRGDGVAKLRERIAELLPRPEYEVELLLPYTEGGLVARVYADGEVLAEEHTPDGTWLRARVGAGAGHGGAAVRLRRCRRTGDAPRRTAPSTDRSSSRLLVLLALLVAGLVAGLVVVRRPLRRRPAARSATRGCRAVRPGRGRAAVVGDRGRRPVRPRGRPRPGRMRDDR